MRVKFEVIPYTLDFRFVAGTSRGNLTQKPTWFIRCWQEGDETVIGWGEASPLKGLSSDFSEDYEQRLKAVLNHLEGLEIPDETNLDFIESNTPLEMPSVRFAIETALLDLWNGGQQHLFPGSFTEGKQRIPINGLVWMGDEPFMQKQIDEKLKAGFNTIKMKVGAIDFATEFSLLEKLRDRYSANELTLRVDANGAFTEADVFDKLEQLASLQIHSIEQPLKQGQRELMKKICENPLLPIALDEELIGVSLPAERHALLAEIKPQFIILKPSLLGGIKACQAWIELAESLGIGWWVTSMLESNVGLNAIAQFTAQFEPKMPQGLGTGQLYHNNVTSPLMIKKGHLHYLSNGRWHLTLRSS